jgi:N-methylhydantoinase A
MGISQIIVPPHPGVLSAAGLLGAPLEHEISAAYPQPLAGARLDEVRGVLARLDEACAGLMRQEGVAPGTTAIRYAADLCYSGQGYHLEIPLHDGDPDPLARLYRDFLVAHDRVYGHATESPARFVNLRAVHRVEAGAAMPWPAGPARSSATKGRRPILIDSATGFETAEVYAREGLATGKVIDGPAIIEQPDTTTVVPRGWRCIAGDGGRLVIEPRLTQIRQR